MNPRERQIWVDRIRACAHFHNEALASNHPSLTSRELMPPTPPGSRYSCFYHFAKLEWRPPSPLNVMLKLLC